VLDFDNVRAHMAGSWDCETRGAAGRHDRHEAGEFVVVEQQPTIFQFAPADALYLNRN